MALTIRHRFRIADHIPCSERSIDKGHGQVSGPRTNYAHGGVSACQQQAETKNYAVTFDRAW